MFVKRSEEKISPKTLILALEVIVQQTCTNIIFIALFLCYCEQWKMGMGDRITFGFLAVTTPNTKVIPNLMLNNILY